MNLHLIRNCLDTSYEIKYNLQIVDKNVLDYTVVQETFIFYFYEVLKKKLRVVTVGH